MASEQKTVDYIVEQMQAAGALRSRKMFGEFAVYCDDKVIAFVCDDRLLLKITEPVRKLLKREEFGKPYPGAKDYFLIDESDWDDAIYLAELARTTADALPSPKKK